ncbi:hypothetical protein [Zavarzinia sp.]|uniref:hypothetical protein n=1 Tax=Zavarzinia sp. TaxID=2027920 RepID=UPI003BB794B2
MADSIVDIIGREFSVSFYLEEYADLQLFGEAALVHYCDIGWIEGRNPNPYFDTVSYLHMHRDVMRAGMHPFFHYLYHGRGEGRAVVPSVTPSARSQLLFGYAVPDWVEALRPSVDVEYYAGQLDREWGAGFDPVAHFAFRGWREGFNPTPTMAIADLIARYRHSANLLVNPLLTHREAEAGRYTPTANWQVPAASAAHDEAATADDASVTAPVPAQAEPGTIADEFDAQYYLATHGDVKAAGIDPLDHYFYTGWREGRNPNAEFDSAYYLVQNPDVAALGVNPLWHYVTVGRAEGRAPRDPNASASASLGLDDAARMETVRPELDTEYYLSTYPDVAQAGVDPVEHYYLAGWREGRNPTATFDTNYYLRANEDVAAAGINPFWHFVVAGRAEGRVHCKPGGYRRRIIDAAKPPEILAEGYVPAAGKKSPPAAVMDFMRGALGEAKGICVSLSHDCYIQVIGGTQIFIADEQRNFVGRRYVYLHLSPRAARLDMQPNAGAFDVQVVVNGRFCGIVSYAGLLKELGTGLDIEGLDKLLVIHSGLGFDVRRIEALHRALQPRRSVFWLHDYSSLCEGFNLLRNDLEHCGAPPPDSQVCRVCVYGASRRKHLAALGRLFETCRFDVLSPSKFTLDLWKSRTALPYKSASVHEHWRLVPQTTKRLRAVDRKKAPPACIAFVGFPSAGKGWPLFADLYGKLKGDPRYLFMHFSARGVPTLPGCRHIVAEVTALDRNAMTRLLRDNRVDYLAMLSPWPETFSFVAHEGLAAGCRILCLADSGNVAALARASARGRVFADGQALEDYLKSDQAFDDALLARVEKQEFAVDNCGTTASVRLLFRSSRKP